MSSSSRKRKLVDILKDVVIIVLVLPTVALFVVLALGRSVAEPNTAIALVELGLSIAVVGPGVTMLYFDLREVKR